jgi:hypothetical protein
MGYLAQPPLSVSSLGHRHLRPKIEAICCLVGAYYNPTALPNNEQAEKDNRASPFLNTSHNSFCSTNE